MLKGKQHWAGIGLLGLLISAGARAEVLSLNIEPIVGYEQIKQVIPTIHSVNRTVYGARVIAGVLLISAEAEYTHGVKTETFPDSSQTDTGDKLKAGLRSGLRMGSLLSAHLRAGLQASQEKTDSTDAFGITTTTYQPVSYHPYAGAGARANLTSKISATADIVAVIVDVNNLDNNEYMATAGFAIRLP